MARRETSGPHRRHSRASETRTDSGRGYTALLSNDAGIQRFHLWLPSLRGSAAKPFQDLVRFKTPRKIFSDLHSHDWLRTPCATGEGSTKRSTMSHKSMKPLQVVRAMLWAAIAVPVIRMMKGQWWEAGLAVALLFGVVGTSLLLLPNPLMPPEVRMTHLLETASSNFLFGWLLVLVFLKRRRSQRETAHF